MPYTLERAEEFEQAYLHLAHLYVERGKFDLAQVLCVLNGTLKGGLTILLSYVRAWFCHAVVLRPCNCISFTLTRSIV